MLSEHGPADWKCRLIACVLAKHANRNGQSCFPSIPTIADEAGVHERTVRRALGRLEVEKWIKIRPAGVTGRGWRRHGYELFLPEGADTESTPEVWAESPDDEEGAGTESNEVRAQSPPRTSIEDDNTYTNDFRQFWDAYPKREGSNSKTAAYRKWKATLKHNGRTPEDLTAGATRYARYCDSTDPPQTGTRFVMQASRFLGPDKHWCEEWSAPAQLPDLYPDLQ